MTDSPREHDQRTEPGVCRVVHGPHVWCAKCIPNFAAARRCCRKHESEDLNGSIFGRHFIVCPTCQDKRCAHADDCANSCTGQQPAQPGSGGVRPVRGRISAGCDTYIGESDDLWYSAEAYRRLQSALTAAKAYSDDLETRYHTAHERLTAAQQRIAELERDLENERARGIHSCHDQCPRPLCVAQRRIAELRGCLAELTALVNGESPALLNEDSGGDGELAVRIDNALEDPS